MTRFTIRIADTVFQLESRYPSVKDGYADYLTDASPAASFSVTEEELEAAWQAHHFTRLIDCRTGRVYEDDALGDPAVAAGWAETEDMVRMRDEENLLYRKVGKALHRYDAFLFHGCAVMLDGKGYVFSGRSGVGKSTHAGLWLKHFGSRAEILNGDKPIVAKRNGQWMVYGSPWQGKENLGCSKAAPLKGICFLQRGEVNRMAPMTSPAEALFHAVMQPEDRALQCRFLDLLTDMTHAVPMYRMAVNNFAPDAVAVSAQALTGTP